MPNFQITPDLLKQAFTLNSFSIPDGVEMVFVGLRGCLPSNTEDFSEAGSKVLVLREIDHKNLRCSIIQWKISQNLITGFAASTVPHINNILGFKKSPPQKSNCLMPGFYKFYMKGKHRPKNQGNWHDAFRQNGQPLTIRRTFNDTIYNNFDNIEVSTGCDDNMHAAWTLDEDSGRFASAGCQVIMGRPFCDNTKAMQNDDMGPWATFRKRAYALTQSHFPYALFQASELFKLSQGLTLSKRVKFGSSGQGVTNVQSKLISLGYLAGPADGDFGSATFNAVKKFQENTFGKDEVDCVVGPVTALALGVAL